MTNEEILSAWTAFMQAQEAKFKRKLLYDFGWHLEHVPEPRDKRR